MLVIVSVMLVVLVLSGLVLGAVAYPLRGRVPTGRPRLARALFGVADLLRVLDAEPARRAGGADPGGPRRAPGPVDEVPATSRD